jgi:DNA polymerase (family X)
MTNPQIADVFRRLANLMELRGDNPFKLRAYRTAADVIEDTQTPLVELLAAGGVSRLRELPGIGEAISKKIADLLASGTFKAYEEVKSEIPETVLDLLQVEGLGMKTLQILFHQFHLSNLNDFAKFVAGGGLDSVPLMGEKGQKRVQESLRDLGYQT